MRILTIVLTVASLLPLGAVCCGAAPGFIRDFTKRAGEYDPTKDPNENPPPPAAQPAQPQPAAPAPAAQPPVDPLAAHLSAWINRGALDGTKVKLYYAHPDYRATPTPKLPALVVVQEWWGVNDDIQQRTRDLAAKGYYAVAVDLYDGKVTADPKEAATLKTGLTDAAALTRLKVAVDFLQDQAAAGIVDAGKIGVIGWCMGGEQALKLAVADGRIKGTVIFYGPLITDAAKLANLHGPVLGVFGNDDKHPSPEDVNAFEAALKANGTPVTIYRYDGVGHAFASPSAKALGLYHEKEGNEAFAKTYAWLAANLK